MSVLDGILVADFTRIFSGPFCTQILGDLGADVIKIEREEGGDEARSYGVKEGNQSPGSPFLAMNRNKRSMTLDLKTRPGRELARQLVAKADVLVHNFRPGVMKKLGLDFETAIAANPGLVYCEISGFGSKGPLSTKSANDLSIQAFSGLLSITGEPEGPPVRNPAPVCDITAGLYATIGILGALIDKNKTGKGQRVETSMLGGQLNVLNHFLVEYLRHGVMPKRTGTQGVLGQPNQAFPTVDGYICVTVANEVHWQNCCAALRVPELAQDPRFATLTARYKNKDPLVKLISDLTKTFSTADLLRQLDAVGVPASAVNTIADVLNDPQVSALGILADVELESKERVSLVLSPLDFSRSPIRIRRPPPRLGEHNACVLKDINATPTG